MSENIETTPEVVTDKPVVDTEVAKSKTRAFFARHKTKFVVAGSTTAAAALFIAGRASKDVVDDASVDFTVETPEDSNDDN